MAAHFCGIALFYMYMYITLSSVKIYFTLRILYYIITFLLTCIVYCIIIYHY